MKYLKTWSPGHRGEYGSHAYRVWKQSEYNEDIYEFITNPVVKMVRIGDCLYPVGQRGEEFMNANEEDLKFYEDLDRMTDYTSF